MGGLIDWIEAYSGRVRGLMSGILTPLDPLQALESPNRSKYVRGSEGGGGSGADRLHRSI